MNHPPFALSEVEGRSLRAQPPFVVRLAHHERLFLNGHGGAQP